MSLPPHADWRPSQYVTIRECACGRMFYTWLRWSLHRCPERLCLCGHPRSDHLHNARHASVPFDCGSCGCPKFCGRWWWWR